MKIGDFIQLARNEPSLQFLVIGGYAVGAHGHARATFDVDFLARRTDRDEWVRRMEAAGLEKVGEANAFAQFSQVEGDGFDLMFVKEETFSQMFTESIEKEFDGQRAGVPSLDHLLALKLHALKQKVAHRTSKDAEDVELLVRRNGLDISQLRYEELFLKYGSREIYETFLRVLRR